MRFALLTVAIVGCLFLAQAEAKSVADYKEIMLSAKATQGTCGGSCSSSAACANAAGDLLCRCVNFVCSITGPCGGGCLTDGQCADWAGGDENCVCTSTFHCAQKKIVRA